jgi:hypothetical protein
MKARGETAAGLARARRDCVPACAGSAVQECAGRTRKVGVSDRVLRTLPGAHCNWSVRATTARGLHGTATCSTLPSRCARRSRAPRRCCYWSALRAAPTRMPLAARGSRLAAFATGSNTRRDPGTRCRWGTVAIIVSARMVQSLGARPWPAAATPGVPARGALPVLPTRSSRWRVQPVPWESRADHGRSPVLPVVDRACPCRRSIRRHRSGKTLARLMRTALRVTMDGACRVGRWRATWRLPSASTTSASTTRTVPSGRLACAARTIAACRRRVDWTRTVGRASAACFAIRIPTRAAPTNRIPSRSDPSSGARPPAMSARPTRTAPTCPQSPAGRECGASGTRSRSGAVAVTSVSAPSDAGSARSRRDARSRPRGVSQPLVRAPVIA